LLSGKREALEAGQNPGIFFPGELILK
jgi:hypothetical protein